jgi:peptidyl-prolyl cis-trans isomerase B (cyclophilin B)
MIRFARSLIATLLLAAVILPGLSPAAAAEDTETVVTLKTNRGDIVLRFFPASAPEHVKNFVAHSKSGLYAGCLFHRVIPGFMIQGGDPNSKDKDPANDGMGGYSYKGEGTMLPAEFNERKHTRGILSMARSREPDSAGSQFFVMHADAPFLDGKYSVFGETIDGIEVVDAIVNTPRNSADRPNEEQKILSVTVEDWPTATVEATKAAMLAEDKAAPKK